jgi:20S proteasome alpha/beta subunit
MSNLYLEDHGTDRRRFVTGMLTMKERDPKAYEVLRDLMRAFAGDKGDSAERADMVRRYRALKPSCEKVARIADELAVALAQGAAS